MTTPHPSAEPSPVHDDSRTPNAPIHDTDTSRVGCRFDPAATRAWLTSTQPDADATVAEVLHIDDDFDLSGFHKWPRINKLLAAAQDDGIFGVPGHTIGVLHLAGDRGFVDQHRVTLDTPYFGVLCSDGFDTVKLLTDHLSGVDAAVHLLAHTARATDTLLHQRALLAHVDWPTPPVGLASVAQNSARGVPQHGAGRAFRPLALAEPAASSPASPPDSAAAARRRRR